MENVNIIGQRIDEARVLVGMTKAEFAAYLDLSNTNYDSYLKGKSFERTKLDYLIDLGINPIWIIKGEGGPFLRNETGTKHIIKNRDALDGFEINKKKRNDLILKWIEHHFSSLEQFCIEKKCDHEAITWIIKHERLLPTSFLKKLKDEGMNINWIYSKDKDPYSNSEKGRERRKEYRNSNHEGTVFSQLVEI